ncbi:MAG: hypothetical protein ACOY3I_01240 [Verrucomicrobiota bacterium]
MNARMLFELGWCVALLLGFIVLEKGFLGNSFSSSASKPAKVWWQESHKKMRYDDSPWVWIEYSSCQQQARQQEFNTTNEPQVQGDRVQSETWDEAPTMPTRSDEMRRMRLFRLQKLQGEHEVQRL